ncbi:MAG: ATP-dependent helicase HrpB [Pseudomonadota bacterium]
MKDLPEYPLSVLHTEFLAAVACGNLLLEAEPGAGKSTLAPLWVLANVPAHKMVWLIQPRVLAAQALAQRLAELTGDALGQTVGYQVPYDNCSSEKTRLLLMTPGILLQHLLQNPTLDDVACVMLDEIHERSVNQDTAWAWLQEVQILRDDLQLVLMSATPDPALQQKIAQRLFTPGKCFPVTTIFLPPKTNSPYPEKLEEHLLRCLHTHSAWQKSTTLVFLPSWYDIEKCTQAIQQGYPDQVIYRLHSRVPAVEQKRALDPAQGPRIILATNIAETSLTIADVTLVIDSGLVRRADYEQRTGLTRLRTSRISQASADQRRGRAGRVQAGQCIRLWSQDQPLAAANLPEIRATDYLPLALRLAHWGSPVQSLSWLESPNSLALNFAQQQLQKMDLLDAQLKITAAGAQVSALGTHPRIAALLLSHQQKISEATMLLALALHFDLGSEDGFDTLLENSAQELKRNRQWQQQQKRWLGNLTLNIDKAENINALAIARAFSDRIGFKQDSGRYRLNSDISVVAQEKLNSTWAVFPIINPKPKGHAGIGIALELSKQQQRSLSQAQTQLIHKNCNWFTQTVWRMGGVVIDEQIISVASEKIAAELLLHIRELITEKGFSYLSWSDNALRLLQRARFLTRYNKDAGNNHAAQDLVDFPDLSEAALIASLDKWLQPFLTFQTRLDQLPWLNALEFYLGYDNCQKIAQLLPEKIQLPSGRNITVEFSAEGVPQVSAKLQEFFGCEKLELAHGKLPLKIHLLAPNGSPLAITANLQTFWQQGYPDVRKDARGKYPRHPWPENPLEHEPTALTKRRLAQQNPQ